MARILRIPIVLERLGIGRSTLYEMQARGEFPQSIPIGTRSVGFLESDVNEWIEARARRARGPSDEAAAARTAA